MTKSIVEVQGRRKEESGPGGDVYIVLTLLLAPFVGLLTGTRKPP